MIILGIDPGIATTGYGIIETQRVKRTTDKRKNHVKIDLSRKNSLKCVDFGIIKTDPKNNSGERLLKLYKELDLLMEKYPPDLLSIESLYFFKNLKTAIPVSQARGVMLLLAAQKKIPVIEFTPLEIKMTITGYGRAMKEQVQKMIKLLLDLDILPKPDDASDALGAAICGAFKLK